MRGLSIAERYFAAYGLPMIRGVFPREAGRIAAGLVGDGSDCLGFDDAHSRDHDWGPGFCLWLTDEDDQAFGRRLQEEYDRLPQHFAGIRRQTSTWGQGRVGVFAIGAFYRSFIGRRGVPQSLLDWWRIPEKNLAACTSGKVFTDPLGEFSAIRDRLLAFYPEDVRLAKIAARCMAAGQSGQYNFQRCTARGEIFAAQYAETKFCADLMSLVYLLNRQYAPYYKWLHRGLSALPILGRLTAETVSAMTVAREPEKKAGHMAVLCQAVIDQLVAEGLSDSDSRFLADHGPEVHGRIADAELRKINVWAG